MPLFIRDDEVNALAQRLQVLTGTRTKTEAVKRALEQEIRRETARLPLSRRIAPAIEQVRAIRAEALAMGLKGQSDFDMKAFTDEMWDG